MNEPERYFVKLFRNGDLDWMGLSGLTRGLYDELLLLADRVGRIRLGRAGLRALEIPLRESWANLEPHVAALVDLGAVVVEGDALFLPTFEADQGRPKTGAERMAKLRASQVTSPTPPASPDVPSDETASRPVTERHTPSRVTLGDVASSRVTDDGQAPSRVTLGDASDDKERSDQTDQIRQKEEAVRAAPAQPPPDKGTRAILEALQAVPALENLATLAVAESLVVYVHNGAKALDWVLAAIADVGAEATLAAGSAKGPMAELHLNRMLRKFVQEAKKPRDPAGFSPRGATVGPNATDAEVEAAQRKRGVQVGARDWSQEAVVVAPTGGVS